MYSKKNIDFFTLCFGCYLLNSESLVKLTIRLNEELKTKNIELQDIIESLPQGLIATDTQGVIVHFNKAVSEFTQIASKEAQSKKINVLFGIQIIPDNFISLQKKGEKVSFYE